MLAPGEQGKIVVFFVLKGKGHDVHDGRRYDWEAGDALIVEDIAMVLARAGGLRACSGSCGPAGS